MLILKIITTLWFNAITPLRILFNEWSHGLAPEDIQRFAAAHEAGHALIASLYAAPPAAAISYGSLNDYGMHGETLFPHDGLDLLNTHAKVGMLCAGVIAVSMLGTAPKGEGSTFGAHYDFVAIAGFLEQYGMSLDDVRHAVFQAASLLDLYRSELEALATALYERKFLSGAEIAAIVSGR